MGIIVIKNIRSKRYIIITCICYVKRLEGKPIESLIDNIGGVREKRSARKVGRELALRELDTIMTNRIRRGGATMRDATLLFFFFFFTLLYFILFYFIYFQSFKKGKLRLSKGKNKWKQRKIRKSK